MGGDFFTAKVFETECTSFLAQAKEGDPIFQEFDTVAPHDSRSYNLRLPLRNRLTPLPDIDENEVGNALRYFRERDDSLYAAIAHLLLSDHYMWTKDDWGKAIMHIKMAERFAPCGYSCLQTHILFSHAYIYRNEYPGRKAEILHRAIDLAEHDSNYTCLGYCYREMMLTHTDTDSARAYAEKAMRPSLLSRLDTLQRLLVMSSFAEHLTHNDINAGSPNGNKKVLQNIDFVGLFFS